MNVESKYRRYIVATGAVALASYGVYEAYKRNVHGRAMRYLQSLRASMEKYQDAFESGGEVCSDIMSGLKEYLRSDGSELPPSLRQLAKLVQSKEFSETTTSTIHAIVNGLNTSENASDDAKDEDVRQRRGMLDTVLEALLSEKGHSLVSVAVSMGARNIVTAYLEHAQRRSDEIAGGGGRDEGETDVFGKILEFMAKPTGQQLAVMCVAACAHNAMKAYMDQTIDINYYEEILSSMTKPEHLKVVKECISLFVRDAVTTYLSSSARQTANEAIGADERPGQPSTCVEIDCVATHEDHASYERHYSMEDDQDDSPCSTNRPTPDVVRVKRVPDEVDSDCVLYSRKTVAKTLVSEPQVSFVTTLGKEFVRMAKDPDGREAIVSVVGCATKEAAGAVATVVADRIQPLSFVLVLFLGICSAIFAQLLLQVLT